MHVFILLCFHRASGYCSATLTDILVYRYCAVNFSIWSILLIRLPRAPFADTIRCMAKYEPFGVIQLSDRQWPSHSLTKAPVWCSVDLRDGNQALRAPMSVEQKLEFFDLLVRIGFKEIEVGFPASNDTEYTFVRRLIDEGRIPDDVTIQVLSQARGHLVKQTMQAVAGAKNVIFHLYNAISPVHREYTFSKSKDELIALAVEGVENIKQYAPLAGDDVNIRLEYSPEDFSGAETDFAVDICSAVIDAWKPSPANPLILNLPTTVEHAMANVYADQVEFFIRGIGARSAGLLESGAVIISLHNHNDRGTGVACCELGLLAGATRVEGTLFGNGERTGNLDIVTVALNMKTQGIETGLDFSHIIDIVSAYTRLTGMAVPPRQPYGGELVFTAFSGSHQDAIRKALSARSRSGKPDDRWDIPYLPIDPRDLGRQYQEIIRVNAQSGKGGAAWVLEQDFGILLPKGMLASVGAAVKKQADYRQRDLEPSEIFAIFKAGWLNTESPLSVLDLAETHVDGSDSSDNVLCRASILWQGEKYAIGAKGNGPLAAFAAALGQTPVPHFTISAFHEHAVGEGSDTEAMAYVELSFDDGSRHWGCGRSTNIGRAGVYAIVSAINRL